MSTRKNLKSFRQKPTIYGLSAAGFLCTTAVTIVSLLSFLGGITLQKVIFVAIIIGLSYLCSLLLSSNQTIRDFFFDESLPKEFTDDE
jgi:hypothetical protein